MVITSIDNEKVKHLLKLTDNRYRNECCEFMVEGYHLVEEAYKQGYLKMLFVEENDSFKLDNIETYNLSRIVFNRVSGLTNSHQAIGICEMLPETALVGSKYLLLDCVQDPGNIGTIIRCAKAFNVDTIILGTGCASIYNQKLIRATQGLLFHLNIMEKSLQEVIPMIKKQGIKVLGTSLTDAQELVNLKLDKFALVVGNEGNGISSDVLAMCDQKVYIKINQQVESLNVAIATAICLYELNR